MVDREGSVTIRIAAPEDAPELARLLEAFNGPTVTSQQAESRLLAMQGIETALLAEVGGRPVGLASLRLVPYLSDDVPYAELTELYVERLYRRRGIGRALVRQAEAMARERGAKALNLLTGLDNGDAQAFYEAIGYVDDALAMRRALDQPSLRDQS